LQKIDYGVAVSFLVSLLLSLMFLSACAPLGFGALVLPFLLSADTGQEAEIDAMTKPDDDQPYEIHGSPHWPMPNNIRALFKMSRYKGRASLKVMDQMTSNEFSVLKSWFAQEKREPAFWVAVVLPWLFVLFTIVVPAILMTAFPSSDAKKTLQPILQRTDVGVLRYRVGCTLPQGAYIFGYDLSVNPNSNNNQTYFGRVCRDVVNGGWVFATN
jgi:hypothetical protein